MTSPRVILTSASEQRKLYKTSHSAHSVLGNWRYNKTNFIMFFKFFDSLEDKARSRLSRRPILYALLSGIGTVFFFRGVWMIADEFDFLTGPVTLAISMLILLGTGVFVFHFVSDQIIISGLTQEKKLAEKTEAEVKAESATLGEIKTLLKRIDKRLDRPDIS